MACRGFLQCTLKLLNLLLTLVGAAIVLYSLWMLNQWHKHAPIPAPAPVPVEEGFEYNDLIATAKSTMEALSLPTGNGMSEGQPMESLTFVIDSANQLKSSFFPDNLPAPWFIYAFLGLGIITCVITCTGHIAAETTSACCLSCYTCLIIVFLIVQAIATGTIFFYKDWRKEIPDDPTQQLNNIISFIGENADICKWLGLGVLIVEALALLTSCTLRAMADPRKANYDSDDEYLPRAQRPPLANRQPPSAANPPAAGTAPAEGGNRAAVRNDEWSKRMREKYGLDTTEFTYNPSESRRYAQQGAPGTEEKSSGRCCTIM